MAFFGTIGLGAIPIGQQGSGTLLVRLLKDAGTPAIVFLLIGFYGKA